MKAIILSVCAVLLGLAAGFAAAIAVNPESWITKKRVVLIAKESINTNGVVEVKVNVDKRSVPDRYVPPDAIDASNDWLIDGLTTKNNVVEGGYILYSDLKLDTPSN